MGEEIASFLPRAAPQRIAIALAAIIFALDTWTAFAGAIAVAYVVVLVIGSASQSRLSLIRLTSLCVALATFSFWITHWVVATPAEIVRFAVALIAIAITAALLLRELHARSKLVAANESLRHSKWRYRAIFQQSRFPLWEQDFSRAVAVLREMKAAGLTNLTEHNRNSSGFLGCVIDTIVTTDVNQAMLSLLGTERREEALVSLTPFHPNEETMLAMLQAIQDGAQHFDGRGRITARDGRPKDVIVAISINQEGERAGSVVGALIDVTEREKAQQALAAAHAELARASRVATVGALSASIAHELNQPLGATIMNSQTCLRYLRRDPPDIASAIAAAERAVREGNRASDIVSETRELVTNHRSHEELVDLAALSREVLEILERDTAEIGAEVVLRAAPGVPPILAERTAMQQVLVNLVTNALQATARNMSASPRLELDITSDESHVFLTVSDNGPGIAREDMDRIFESFFTTKEGGMGMGLAISRIAVEAREGTLRACNREDGGAVFECRLPITRETVNEYDR